MSDTEKTATEPWGVHFEDLRGGRYWVVEVPGNTDPDAFTIHEDDGGEAMCRRIAQLPVLEALANGQP